jgi:hypothetical protein
MALGRTTRFEVHLRLSPGKQDIDQAAIEQIRYSPGVQRDIHRRADNVADYMREHVGVKTGELRGTIRTEDSGADVNVMAGRAGQTPQLGYQMYGTAPHTIVPKGPGYPLRFFWAKIGQNVAFMSVSHPGGKRNDFVRESIRAAAP